MRRMVILTVLAVLAVAGCGGDDAVTTTAASTTTTGATTTAAPTTTTAAPTTTTSTLPPTTTTTTAPPPEVAWGAPVGILAIPPGIIAGEGDLSGARVDVITSWSGSALLLVGSDVYGPGRNLGGMVQTDSYSDIRLWSSPDAVEWVEQDGPPLPGFFDEWAAAATPFGESLVVVGSWRESGSTASQVSIGGSNVWTFTNEDTDAAAWVGEGNPPGWQRVDQADFGGERDESMAYVVEIGGVLLAVGEARILQGISPPTPADYDGAVWVSADGLAWQRFADPDGLFSGDTETSLDAACSDGATARAFGVIESGGSDTLTIWSTADGTSWERVDATGDGLSFRGHLAIADVACSAAGTVVVGYEFGNSGRYPAVWHSADGLAWERAELDIEEEGELVAVTATPAGFITVGATQGGQTRPLLFLSGDGRTWFEEPSGAFEIEGATRTRLTAVGLHEGTVIVAGLALYLDDVTEVTIWSGPLG